LPKKIPKKSCNGFDDAFADTDGEVGVDAAAPTPPGSPVVVDAAGAAVAPAPSNSRRVNAAAPHAKPSPAGEPEPPPVANHDSNDAPTPDTAPEGVADITGAAAAAAAAGLPADTTAGNDRAPEPEPPLRTSTLAAGFGATGTTTGTTSPVDGPSTDTTGGDTGDEVAPVFLPGASGVVSLTGT
jgi:hypothetical protein